jgi:ApbE superfamily uncharacterized protein (UPF0280 family)
MSRCGTRLHLQHGPIDLIIGCDGERAAAFNAAQTRFATVLEDLVAELPALRTPLTSRTPRLDGAVAKRMHRACLPFCDSGYLTRMASVAGAVADEVLGAMRNAADLTRVYVNNGGDISLELKGSTRYETAILSTCGTELGRVELAASDGIGGIATSGRHGRSLSLGIADSVTVLARDAATADVAATLVANAVDLPGHPDVSRAPAGSIVDDSDLGDLPVVTGCAALSAADCDTALARGIRRAGRFIQTGRIAAAALVLQGRVRVIGKDRCFQSVGRFEHV